MALSCDRFSARFGPKAGLAPPVRAADAPKRAENRPLRGAVLFAAEQRSVVGHDAQASLLPNALSANKNNRVTINAIYEFMT